jgi:hypothetical protein
VLHAWLSCNTQGSRCLQNYQATLPAVQPCAGFSVAVVVVCCVLRHVSPLLKEAQVGCNVQSPEVPGPFEPR